MTFLELAAHVLVPPVRDNARGWAGDVSPALLFLFLAGKMDRRSPSAHFGDKTGTVQGGPIYVKLCDTSLSA